ncbi:MAG: Uma2 family endonuclease [Anaerolineae bacterium]|nr:Uma2 family endonuclease [Anaerolineae bacterium]
MTGGKLYHFVISRNIVVLLSRLLADTDCLVLPGGMLIRVGVASLVAPDVSVICGEPETEADTRILLNPTVVVEVISSSSINHDRVVKRDFYESVASIQAYLIIDQHRPLAELYTRSETGWQLQTFTSLDDEVALDALACQLPLRDIYQKIDFEDGTGAPASADA